MDVTDWINSLPSSSEPLLPSPSLPVSKRKRTLLRPLQTTTPPTSSGSENDMDDNTETLVRKRQRRTIPASDVDLTPRQPAGSLSGSPRSASSATGTHSVRSRSSSPLKRQIMDLRLCDYGVDFRQLQVDENAIPAAKKLLDTLSDISNAHDILPESFRSSIQDKVGPDGLFPWRYSFLPLATVDTLPGRIPLVDEATRIHQAARRCDEDGDEEAGWNAEVYHRLLDAVLRKPGTGIGDPFDFKMCTTARPHRQWLPQTTGLKLIDICIYKAYDAEAQVFTALEELCKKTPTHSVNHTDFEALQLRPIMMSIESKKLGGELRAAQVQMGVWHSAHWTFLRSAVLSAMLSSPLRKEQEQDQVDLIMAGLPFLPGIIVWGHLWLFVYSTREGNRTILWRQLQFGSTERLQGTYQVVAGLREILGYVRDIYQPWFDKFVLGLDRS